MPQGSDPEALHGASPNSQKDPLLALSVLMGLHNFSTQVGSPSPKQKNLPTFVDVDGPLKSLLAALGVGIIAFMPWSSCHWGWLKHRAVDNAVIHLQHVVSSPSKMSWWARHTHFGPDHSVLGQTRYGV